VTAYAGALVSFAVMGAAVFLGSFGEADAAAADPAAAAAEAASRISLGGFYVLMLIHSLTSVLDASQLLSEVAGHAVRVSQLLSHLHNASRPVPHLGSEHRVLYSPGVFVYSEDGGGACARHPASQDDLRRHPPAELDAMAGRAAVKDYCGVRLSDKCGRGWQFGLGAGVG